MKKTAKIQHKTNTLTGIEDNWLLETFNVTNSDHDSTDSLNDISHHGNTTNQ